MPIISRNPLNPGEQTQTTSTTGEVVGAAFQQAWQSGITSNFGLNQSLDDDEHGRQQSEASLARFGPLGQDHAPGVRLTVEEAHQQLADAGLEHELKVPETGIGRESLRILMERKQQELRRQTIERQADGGFWQGSAKIGAGFAGMLVDPVNIAASFVPVVGEARYVKLLAQADSLFARTAIRAGIGAAEGTAGFVPIEAYNYATKQRIQADYTAYDSLLTLASGAAFGTALHAGAGFLGDTTGRSLGFEPAWVRSARESRQARAGEVFETTATKGQPDPSAPRTAEHDPLFAAEARERAVILDRLAEGRPLTREAAESQAALNLRDGIRGELIAQRDGKPLPFDSEMQTWVERRQPLDLPQVTQRMNARDQIRAAFNAGLVDEEGAARLFAAAKEGKDPHNAEVVRAGLHDKPIPVKAQEDAREALRELDKGEIPEAFSARITAEADRLLGSTGEAPLSAGIAAALGTDPFLALRPVLARMQPETQAQALRMAVAQAATGRAIDVTPALLGDPAFGAFANEVGPLIRARTAVNGVATADHAASKAADAQIARGYKGELVDEARALVTAEEADLRALAKQGGHDIEALLTQAGEAMQEAHSAGEAGRAAAMCLMRTGG